VVRLRPDQPGYRVPNFGWHDAAATGGNPLFDAAAGPQPFYFAHSYHFVSAAPADVAATIDYSGRKVAAAVARGNVFGLQFHPEKSQDAGLDVLARFIDHVRAQGRAV
jgi:glutamine amidotransferase